jgi:hypothetical protein
MPGGEILVTYGKERENGIAAKLQSRQLSCRMQRRKGGQGRFVGSCAVAPGGAAAGRKMRKFFIGKGNVTKERKGKRAPAVVVVRRIRHGTRMLQESSKQCTMQQ